MWQIFIRILYSQPFEEILIAAQAIDSRVGGIQLSNDQWRAIGYNSNVDDSSQFDGLVQTYGVTVTHEFVDQDI